MARPLRLSFENAVYHITARGNRKENVFYDDNDREVFLEKLNETFQKYSFICYAYCLMNNHYHLFVRTPFANLVQGMHYFNTSYANWFKAKHQIVGVVFQGRYKSIIVDEDSYSLKLSAYIHLNPLRAGLVGQLKDYKWSSYLDYMGRKCQVEKLDTEFILKQFDGNLKIAKRKYKEFVYKNINMENPLRESYKGIALGCDSFIDSIKEKIREIGEDREITETKVTDMIGQEEIFKKVQESLSIKREEIFSKKKANLSRQLTIYLTKKYSKLSLKELGEIFDMDYAAVSQACRRFSERLQNDRDVLRIKDEIVRKLMAEMSNVET